MHSPDHSTKGTPSGLGGTIPQCPLTAGATVVSGSVSSPSRGAFHLSLTVLVHYRSQKVARLGGWSPQLPTSLLVARGTQDANPNTGGVRLPDSHRLWCGLPTASPDRGVRCVGPTTPLSLPRYWFGLDPSRSPLLRVSRLILPRRATEMFQFAHGPPSLPMGSAGGLQTSLWRGCPIRILRAQCLHAAPPERFAGLRVLLRPFAPRHPPRSLCSLFSLFPSRPLAA
jgi:hypothetical protein